MTEKTRNLSKIEPGDARDAERLVPLVHEFLQTGSHDPLFLQFSGNDHLDRIRTGDHMLATALLAEVQARAASIATPKLTVLPKDIKAFARQKVEPMVRGLFKQVEQEAVISLLANSVVFITPDTIKSLIDLADLHSAWLIANLYLRSIGAGAISDQAPPIVGFSENTTCYILLAYFLDDSCTPFSDYVVHEAAHVFHNSRRRDAGLKGKKEDDWLLPIEFSKRENFAYTCEAYSRICELSKHLPARRTMLEELKLLPPPPDKRVDSAEYTELLTNAVNRRNGWKAILEGCAEQRFD
ncbi:MAG: hypothetical protein ABI557_09575 [Aureliella sp.]